MMFLSSFKGDWALVTGATSGIGQEFARRLSAAGLNLILVARRQTQLEELARVLTMSYSIKTHVVPLDLADPVALEKLRHALNSHGIKIRFLCHAAGMGYWGTFNEGNTDSDATLINLHVLVLTRLLHSVHDDLASHPTSAVVVVSSRAAVHPMPTMAVYAAAKSFSRFLALALWAEWKKEGIYVQALLPGPVNTELEVNHRMVAAGLINTEDMETPAQVVDQSLRGLARCAPEVLTGKGVQVQRISHAFLPLRFFLRIVLNRYSTWKRT